MKIEAHETKGRQVAEILDEAVLLSTEEEGMDLVGNLYFQGFEGLILKDSQIGASFFDLKTKLAGAVLQKFSNYRMRLAIVGDFENVASKSLKDFIRESNKMGFVIFVPTREHALEGLF
ncbi:DUF4180 domain-containing protein [Marinilongibacter aquaticus]|uniref:DUF4180 domain-containing protein n=1 Tax=Marinilongibacter aquaticus TaxID=2975157 RepID=UPI0021BDB7EC|nr:DUF4180 domain-containing protein [Marinilongibacter aquaticus]UBM60628.1 DUF4180 domain-containing protein [Marinilongibacter aquaticus]